MASSDSTLKRLLGEFKPFRTSVIVVVVLGIIVSAIQPISLKVTQLIIDQLKTSVDPKKFQWLALLIIPVFIVNGLAKYFYNTIRRVISEKVIQKLRTEIFQKYLTQSLSQIESQKTGELLSKIQNDLSQVNSGIDTFCSVLKEPFTFLGLIAMAVYFDWKLTLCVFVVAPFVVLLFSRSGSAVRRYSEHNLIQFSDLISMVQESISGARIVKIFNLENRIFKRYLKVQNEYFNTLVKSIKVQEIATPAVELVGTTLMAGIFIYAGYRISTGTISLGDLLSFLLALGLSQMPIKQLNNGYLKIKIAEAAAKRVYAVIDSETEEFEENTSFQFNQSIELKNISVNFQNKIALKNISLAIHKNQTIAIVGKSGSGKTTLINLLPKLIHPQQGEVLIDGVDIEDISTRDLRDHISIVSQDPFLFHASIYENIGFGKHNATDNEIIQAAEHAYCKEFIEKCPEGYQTIVGERGYSLSGGERQRIAIARAFLKNAPILILDEATSNLDPHSEKRVQQALEDLRKDKTTLLISHRYSNLKKVDKIFVLEAGELVQVGHQEDLQKIEGGFSHLFKSEMTLGI
jgi:subfamily B ATP-binding cassette protein MsbA